MNWDIVDSATPAHVHFLTEINENGVQFLNLWHFASLT